MPEGRLQRTRESYRAVDPQTGVAIRFIQQFDAAEAYRIKQSDIDLMRRFLVQPENRDLILMCGCEDVLTCEHPWPMIFPSLPWRAPHENAAEQLTRRSRLSCADLEESGNEAR